MAQTKPELPIYWEVFRDGERIAYGPEPTMPDVAERRIYRGSGFVIKVKGKVFEK